VVAIPGISGSVLQRDGKDVWAVSASAAIRLLRTSGRSLQDLALDGGDVDVKATGLIKTTQIIPGLAKVEGYTALRAMVEEGFDVVPGANYVEFPYDWRLDNRVSAERLGEEIGARLQAWRKQSGASDAKVILLAHSMGGLVSRYWLERLGGWADCRALITFGTPHRGSVNALGFLANGFKKLFVDLTTAMRSFPSAYQLLPIYPAIRADGQDMRAGEHAVRGLDPRLAADGLAFHREIEAAVNANQQDERYLADGYALIPIVGTRQPTNQSAELTGDRLTLSRDPPAVVDPILGGGDGTVPRISATPIELSTAFLDSFVVERHGALQSAKSVLQDVSERIVSMQARGASEVRAVRPTPERADRPALAVEVDDAYAFDEPVAISAVPVGQGAPPATVRASLTALSSGETRTEAMGETAEGWSLETTLPPDQYRLTVDTSGHRHPPVHDVFEVMDAEL
jgi:pimeloyl-ACP methyl ester carboxylesterase